MYKQELKLRKAKLRDAFIIIQSSRNKLAKSIDDSGRPRSSFIAIEKLDTHRRKDYTYNLGAIYYVPGLFVNKRLFKGGFMGYLIAVEESDGELLAYFILSGLCASKVVVNLKERPYDTWELQE